MTIAPKQSREAAASMPRKILIGDLVRLKPKRSGPYLRTYGRALEDAVWTVTFIDKVGRKRLYVDRTPSAIFAADAMLAYKGQSKMRRDQLTKMGTKLP